MSTFRKILVGLELDPAGTTVGEGSEHAAAQALDLAGRVGSSVTLLHSIKAEEHYEPGAEKGLWTHQEGLSEEGRANLDALLKRFTDMGVEARLELAEKRAEEAIIEAVARDDIDLVLVGKREHREFDFDDRPLGAVALKLLRRCPAAVWTVATTGDRALRRILAATDLSQDVGTRIVAAAGRLAVAYDAELVVLHARPRGLGEALVGSSDDRVAEALEDAEASVRSILSRIEGAPEPQVIVTGASPTGAIVEASRENHPDLLVLGTVARRGVRAALIGNTAERIFGLVDRPLLTLKPDGFRAP
jgi:nucleotide-binding universal stress UspA family protein